MVLDISLYEPYFYYKNNNDINRNPSNLSNPSNPKNSNPKNSNPKNNNVYDKLCHILYHKLNEKDFFYKYNERSEKIKILELLEPIKIKNKMLIINNLNDKDINLITLNFICYILKINIIWYTDKCYYKMLYQNEKNEKLYLYNNEKFTDEPILTDKYEILNLDKPLKCISYYKLDELKEINDMLKLNPVTLKKKDIYEAISKYYKDIKLI